MKRRASFVGGIFALAVVGAAAWWVPGAGAQAAFRVGQPAPEIAGGPWINSEPLSLEKLRGRVVLVEFWTYGWINCKNAIPQLRAWHDRHEKAGLSIVGVHSPEFFWENPRDKVAAACRDLGVAYPVVQDNDHAIWKRFGVRAWPTTIVLDKKGIVRGFHIGEGAYDETEALIRRLLAEPA